MMKNTATHLQYPRFGNNIYTRHSCGRCLLTRPASPEDAPLGKTKWVYHYFSWPCAIFSLSSSRFSYVETNALNSHSGKPWHSTSLGLTYIMHSTVWLWKLAFSNTKAQANGCDQRLYLCLKQFSHQKEITKTRTTTILILPFKIPFFKIFTVPNAGRAVFNIVDHGLCITNPWHTCVCSICCQAKCNFTHVHESINKS